jgi:hypothetical protein
MNRGAVQFSEGSNYKSTKPKEKSHAQINRFQYGVAGWFLCG